MIQWIQSHKKRSGFLLIAWALIISTSCSKLSEDQSGGSLSSDGELQTSLPEGLVAYYNCSDLTAELIVDGGSPIPVPVDCQANSISVTVGDLTPGFHEFSINYYLPDLNGTITLVATATVQADITAGQNTPIDFISDLFVYPDNDGDGISNLDEIDAGTDPKTAPPSAPSGVNATGGDRIILVDWTIDPVVDSYNLYVSRTPGVNKTTFESEFKDINPSEVPFTLTDLANGTSYFIVVTAVNAGGESPESTEVSATPDLFARFAYVVNELDDTLSIYAVDTPSGLLQHRGYIATGSSPRWVVVDPSSRFLYVANLGSDNISGYTIDPITGDLTEMAGSPFDHLAGTVSRPTSMAIDPTGSYLFVNDYTDEVSSSITSYAIDSASGAITFVNSIPSGDQPRGLTVHPSLSFVYAAGELSNDIWGYSFDPGTGIFSDIPGSPFVAGGFNPVSVSIHSNGQFLYSANGGRFDEVSTHTISTSDGSLTLSNTIATSGNRPSSIIIDPLGNYAYMSDAREFSPNGTISTFSIDPSTGDLGLLGPDLIAGDTTEEVFMHPSGTYLYAINAGSSDVSIYSADATTGALSPIGAVSTRSGPLSMAMAKGLSPVLHTPKFAYAANQNSSSISSYSIDTTIGALTPIETLTTDLATPKSLTAHPSGLSVYVANSGNDEILSYLIDQTSGTLSLVDQDPATNANPFSISVGPASEFAFTLDPLTLSSYRIDPTTGSLTFADDILTSAGVTSQLSLEPSGRFIYVVDPLANTIQGFSIASGTGVFSQIAGGPFPANAPTSMTVHPFGRYAYIANNDPDEVVLYTLDASSGVLSEVVGSATPAGNHPIALAIDPFGRFLYSANLNDDTISVFSLHPLSGALTFVETEPTLTGPASITVDVSGQFVYVANSGQQRVSAYTIDQTTGELTVIENEPAGQFPVSIATTGIIE